MSLSIRDLGTFASLADLWAAHPEGGHEGDYATVNGERLPWNKYTRNWGDGSGSSTPGHETKVFDGGVIINQDLTVLGSINGSEHPGPQVPVGNGIDIDQDNNGKLQFANRVNGENTSGMGYVVLRKNKTFTEQVTATNTIYEVRDSFFLSANHTIPAGCILFFNGGKIDGNNHTLTFNKTIISGVGKFANCEFAGSILNDEVKISWFTDGMSSSSDYSTDHSAILISAMKLASLKERGWLNLEKTPLCIKQSIVITDVFGNIGIRGGNIYFLSSSDRQALFDYQQTASYRGNYSPIIDSTFRDVGDHYNTCVIKKTNWSDTFFTYWRDIYAKGFTGYFFVTNSYVQEVTFENISLDGFGMFSTNSNALYDGGRGSGNIINFLNCNINGGSSTSKTTINSLYDLSWCIEVTIHNAVSQGKIGGSDIYPIHINNQGVTFGNRSNIELDGFWVEFTDGHVNGIVHVINSSCLLIAKRNSPYKYKIENSNVTLDVQVGGGIWGYSLWGGLDIDSTSNVTIKVDSGLYGGELINAASYPAFKNLLDSGVLRVVKTTTPPYGDSLNQTGVSISMYPKDSLDAKKRYLETKMVGYSVYGRSHIKNFLSNENGLPILNFYNLGETGQYYEFSFLKELSDIFHGGMGNFVARSFYVEIIYRATILVDVTGENISDVFCTGRGFLNPGGGTFEDFITPEIGMAAGETTGWKRFAFCRIWAESGLASGMYMKIRNCKLEIAQFKMCRRNVVLDDEVFVDGAGNLKWLNPHNETLSLPIAAASDNPATMADIVTDCLSLVQTPKNVYRYMDGTLRRMVDDRRKGGTTAQRPTLSAGDVGFTYYDSTLGKTTIWNGSAWVNIDGSAIA